MRDLPAVLKNTVTLASYFDPDNSPQHALLIHRGDTQVDSPTSPAVDPSAAHAAANLDPKHYPARDAHMRRAIHYHRSLDMLEDDIIAYKGSPDADPE